MDGDAEEWEMSLERIFFPDQPIHVVTDYDRPAFTTDPGIDGAAGEGSDHQHMAPTVALLVTLCSCVLWLIQGRFPTRRRSIQLPESAWKKAKLVSVHQRYPDTGLQLELLPSDEPDPVPPPMVSLGDEYDMYHPGAETYRHQEETKRRSMDSSEAPQRSELSFGMWGGVGSSLTQEAPQRSEVPFGMWGMGGSLKQDAPSSVWCSSETATSPKRFLGVPPELEDPFMAAVAEQLTSNSLRDLQASLAFQRYIGEHGLTMDDVKCINQRLSLYKKLREFDPDGFRRVWDDSAVPGALSSCAPSSATCAAMYVANYLLYAVILGATAVAQLGSIESDRQPALWQVAATGYTALEAMLWFFSTSNAGLVTAVRWQTVDNGRASWVDILLAHTVEGLFLLVTLGTGAIASLLLIRCSEDQQSIGERVAGIRLVC